MNEETNGEVEVEKEKTTRPSRFALVNRLAIPANFDISFRDDITTPNLNVFRQFRSPPSLRDFLSRHSRSC